MHLAEDLVKVVWDCVPADDEADVIFALLHEMWTNVEETELATPELLTCFYLQDAHWIADMESAWQRMWADSALVGTDLVAQLHRVFVS